MAARWYDAATLEHYIDPVLADLQAEYEDAVRCGRTWQGRWIWVRGHIAFFTVILCQAGGQAMRMLQDVNGDDRKVLMRACAWTAVTMILGTLLLAAVPFLSFVQAGRPDAAKLALYLVPQALPLSIPLGLTLGVLYGLGRAVASHSARRVVLLVAASLSVASFVMLAWIVPSTNQAFRVSVFEAPLAKGANELTLPELRRFLHSVGNEPAWPPPDDIRNLALSNHRRWAMACAPLVVSFFALVVIGSGQCTRLLLALASFVAIFGYYSLMGAGDIGWLPPAFAAWVPNAVFLVASIAGTMVRSPRSTTPAGA